MNTKLAKLSLTISTASLLVALLLLQIPIEGLVKLTLVLQVLNLLAQLLLTSTAGENPTN